MRGAWFIVFFITRNLLLEVTSLVTSISRCQWSKTTTIDSSWRLALLEQSGNLMSSEALMNQRLKELGEEELDFELIRRTIADWSKPLPSQYVFRPLVLVGPSGVGKGRLVKSLMRDYKRFFVKLVTHTTRGPRPDEINGTSYHFVANATFHRMVEDGKFMEWAQVHDNCYGTSIEAWQTGKSAGKICIMEIDVQGARSIKGLAAAYGIRPKFLFIAPPAIEMLRERLLLRGTETPEQIQLRIASAERELAESKKDDTLFDLVVVNEDYQKTVNTFFRTMRDWYPALPSAARIRMLQRRLNKIKLLGTSGSGIPPATTEERTTAPEEDDEQEQEQVDRQGQVDAHNGDNKPL